MNKMLNRLIGPKLPSESLININISRKNLLHNLSEFHKLSGCIVPVLKSNAYGHGLLEVAEILKNASVPFFVVDSYFEAHTLRHNGVEKPLLIIGYTLPKTILENRLKEISFVITSLETLKEISLSKNKLKIHLKIDTGMNRQGLLPEEFSQTVGIIKEHPNLNLDGICTHFSDADNEDEVYTNSQITKWNKIAENAKEEFPAISYFHISNTAGHPFLNSAISNVSRLGIGLYGLSSGGKVDEVVDLKPVLSAETIITGIKNIKKGDSVGYSKTFVAKKDMKIATIPFGYFEGLDRRLSNKGYIKIADSLVPIIGRVSMNITIVDISNIEDAKIGDRVEVISNNHGDKNSIDNFAKQCNTIPYEIAVHIPAHLKRVVV